MKNYKTKKFIGVLAIVVVAMLVGCAEKAVEKEVIIVPAPAPTVTIEKEEPTKATSIKLDKNGAEVQTEKLEVVIKK